jgi:hypothetical protein
MASLKTLGEAATSLDLSFSLTQFTIFNKLPRELRDEVWKLVASESRKIKLRTNSQTERKKRRDNKISG